MFSSSRSECLQLSVYVGSIQIIMVQNSSFATIFFYHGATDLVGQGLLIIKHS